MNISLILSCLALATSSGAQDDDNRCNADDGSEILGSGANDVVVIRQLDGNLKATQFQVQVGKLDNFRTLFRSRQGRHMTVEVNGHEVPVRLTVTDSGSACFSRKVKIGLISGSSH